MRIGAWKSGSFGDMADYIVLLYAIMEKHPGELVHAMMNFSPALPIFHSTSKLIRAESIDVEDIRMGEEPVVRAASLRYDYFYDLRPYVGRCYESLDGVFGLPTSYLPKRIWKWAHEWKGYYENPLSQYQNVLPDHHPGKSHLEISAASCDLPTPDWDSVEITLPEIERPPYDSWVTLNIGAAGYDKGRHQTKLWDIKKWQAVVDRLENLGIGVLQTGVSWEPKLKRCDYFWDMTILEMLALMKESPLHLSAENGSARLRRLVTEKPSVVLFGPTDPVLFGLPGNIAISSETCRPCFWLTEDWHTDCIRGDRVCMESIEVADVVSAVSAEL